MLPVYLDFNATTPLLPEVVRAMMPYLEEHFGNPSSGHAYGKRAKEGVEHARAQVAALLGCAADEIVFTGGGTESNNLALRGFVEARLAASAGGASASVPVHVVTTVIEHPAVLEPCRALEESGRVRVTRVGVDRDGVVDLAALERAIAESGTVLVSVMHANNETGAIQPIAEIARMAHARGIVVHADAAQSVGKVSANVDALGVDLLTVAGHKLYAPKGVGVLYRRRGTPLRPLVRGAGHEGGVRPGTENVASIVALGAACEVARRESATDALAARAGQLLALLEVGIPGLQLNGPRKARLPNTLNLSAPRIRGSAWLAGAPEVAASTGSACHDGRDEPSGVLSAMGIERERALGAVRLSVGRTTTPEEIERAAAALVRAASRAASPSSR